MSYGLASDGQLQRGKARTAAAAGMTTKKRGSRNGRPNSRFPQGFTTPWEVIASARGFTGILKAGRPQGNPGFLAEEGPIFLTRLVIGSERTARA